MIKCIHAYAIYCAESFSRVSLLLHGLWPVKLLCPRDSPGKNIGVGCHSLLQEIFPAQGLNPGLLHCRWILYHLSQQGSPRILEWVAHPFSRQTSQPRGFLHCRWILHQLIYQGSLTYAIDNFKRQMTNWEKILLKSYHRQKVNLPNA